MKYKDFVSKVIKGNLREVRMSRKDFAELFAELPDCFAESLHILGKKHRVSDVIIIVEDK